MSDAAGQPLFCTACGEKLDDFCFSPDAQDLEALRAHAFLCRLEGRHNGRMCAKLYIADDSHPAQPTDAAFPASGPGDSGTLDPRPFDEEALRRAILERIVRGGDTPAEGASPGPEPAP